MQIKHLMVCWGVMLGLGNWVIAQELIDEDLVEQTQMVVVVQKPPATNIEKFEQTTGIVITKGLTRVGTLNSDDEAETNLNVVHMKDATDKKIYGIQVEITAKDARPVRVYIDEDEINQVIGALDLLSKVDKNTLPMELVEAGYKTRGNLEIFNRDMNGGRMAVLRVTSISPLTGRVFVARACFRTARLVEIVKQLNMAKGIISNLKG